MWFIPRSPAQWEKEKMHGRLEQYPCAYVEDMEPVLSICDLSVCRKRSGSCPTSQLGTSSRSRLWSMLDWFLWSSTNWLRSVHGGGTGNRFFRFSTDGIRLWIWKSIMLASIVCIQLHRHILCFVARETKQFLIKMSRMQTWPRFSCGKDLLCAHLSDSLSLYRVTLVHRRRQRGPSATSPSVGEKTRWAGLVWIHSPLLFIYLFNIRGFIYTAETLWVSYIRLHNFE